MLIICVSSWDAAYLQSRGTLVVFHDRTSGDERLSEVNRKLEATRSASSLEVNKLKAELAEHAMHTELLNDQVSDWLVAQVRNGQQHNVQDSKLFHFAAQVTSILRLDFPF